MSMNLRVTHFSPEEATYSQGTEKKTTILVAVFSLAGPFHISFRKLYKPNSVWEMDSIFSSGKSFKPNELFTPETISFIHEFVTTEIQQGLQKIEENEPYVYGELGTGNGELLLADTLNPEDPLVKLGLRLREKIALKGDTEIGFSMDQNGNFIFHLMEGEIDNHPVLIIGFHEILFYHASEDKFAESALEILKATLTQEKS